MYTIFAEWELPASDDTFIEFIKANDFAITPEFGTCFENNPIYQHRLSSLIQVCNMLNWKAHKAKSKYLFALIPNGNLYEGIEVQRRTYLYDYDGFDHPIYGFALSVNTRATLPSACLRTEFPYSIHRFSSIKMKMFKKLENNPYVYISDPFGLVCADIEMREEIQRLVSLKSV